MNTTSHPLTTWWLVRKHPHAALCAFASVVPDLPYFLALFVGLAGAVPAIVRAIATHTGLRSVLFAVISSAWATPSANFLAQKILHNLVLSTAFAAIAWAWRSPRAKMIALGWMLHVWVDLSLHVNDAYAVLWPFTLRVFPAPVSYWDAEHHGRVMALLLGLLAAVLWVLSAARAWRGRERRRRLSIIASAAFGVLAVVSFAGAVGSLFEPDFGSPGSTSWIDDGVRWPADLAPIARTLATGSPETVLGTMSALPAPADAPGNLPWEVHQEPARRALLRGYALDLAGNRDLALSSYREAESLEPVGNIGDKARRYQGEPFRNIPDPPVSLRWLGLFLWGLTACAAQLWLLRGSKTAVVKL